MSNPRRGPMGGHGKMVPGEKAKDFKGTMKKLMNYMKRYKIRIFIMLVFAVGGTIFNIVGPKILGKATTELMNGLMGKINGTGSIDFSKIGTILATVLCLYAVSSVSLLYRAMSCQGYPTMSRTAFEKRSLRRLTGSL